MVGMFRATMPVREPNAARIIEGNLMSNRLQSILIAGGSGFVGSALTESLGSQGYLVKHLTRSTPRSDRDVQWNPASGEIDRQSVEDADIVINLAGASIAGGWWTEKRKQMILKSRVDSTSTLAEAIASAERKPERFISGSAVGYYGDRPGELLDESSTAGEMFLSEVCQQWEHEAVPAREAGVRVVHPRFGVVLSGSGGMLPLISLPFKFALGGKIGGDQHMAWIDLHDLVRIFHHIIENDDIAGPINAVAPQSTTNAEFTNAMGEALNRPTVIPVPRAIAAFAGGQLARELLLPDQNVKPKVLQDSSFEFERPTISDSLQAAFR